MFIKSLCASAVVTQRFHVQHSEKEKFWSWKLKRFMVDRYVWRSSSTLARKLRPQQRLERVPVGISLQLDPLIHHAGRPYHSLKHRMNALLHIPLQRTLPLPKQDSLSHFLSLCGGGVAAAADRNHPWRSRSSSCRWRKKTVSLLIRNTKKMFCSLFNSLWFQEENLRLWSNIFLGRLGFRKP